MKKVTLEMLPKGSLFIWEETIGFKSKYQDNTGLIHAYIIGSGEFFMGESITEDEQMAILVEPVTVINIHKFTHLYFTS